MKKSLKQQTRRTNKYQNLFLNILFLMSIFLVNSCKKDDSNKTAILPTIQTLPLNNVGTYSAIAGGNVLSDGGSAVTERGVCFSTLSFPTIISNNITMDGSGSGNYTSNLSGLSANTTYYVRAYATNSVGTAYGNQLIFTTSSGTITELNCGSATCDVPLTVGTAVSGATISLPYKGGNGGTYSDQTINSTTVTGLTATLVAGSLANGTGSLTYTVNGTPASIGKANFAFNIGGRNCTLSLIVSTSGAGVTFNGYTYPTVVLGNGQEWMAENLRTTVYANGDPIPNVTDQGQWGGLTTGAWAQPITPQYESNYGKLYNWYTVADSRNVCPTGWHVPTDVEWTVLTDYLGGESAAGGKMKSTGTTQASTGLWEQPNVGATNESGFAGAPGGKRDASGYFCCVGTNGIWWSSTQSNTNTFFAWNRGLSSNVGYVPRGSLNKADGYSVRCLRD